MGKTEDPKNLKIKESNSWAHWSFLEACCWSELGRVEQLLDVEILFEHLSCLYERWMCSLCPRAATVRAGRRTAQYDLVTSLSQVKHLYSSSAICTVFHYFWHTCVMS